MSLQSATGAITNIAYLGVTLGALGLALNFTERAFNQGRSPPDYRQPKKKAKMNGGYGFGGYSDYGNYGDYEGYGSYGNGMNGYNKKKKQQLTSDDMFDLSRYF